MKLRNMLIAAGSVGSVAAVSEMVDLGYSRYRGQASSQGVSQWFGMRYAAPPVGQLRFMPPQDPPREMQVQILGRGGKSCLRTGRPSIDSNSSEDCLFINVQAPTNATDESYLPVMLYIQGGGFNLNSDPNINATGIIASTNHSMVVVSFNYRVGPYGFLSDGEAMASNNGLRDQRKAMEWVQAHIKSFGGDPGHVVIVGTSAGGASVAMHLTANGGQDRGLFHGAIGQSPSFATMLTVEQTRYQYKHFAVRLGCYGRDNIACLRNKTAQQIQERNYNIPLPGGAQPPRYQWLPARDGEMVTDFLHRAFAEGKFIHVPTVFGDDMNGGTRFAPRTLATEAEGYDWLLDQYPTLTFGHLDRIHELYPSVNASQTNCTGVPGCYWRQAANVYGEARYMCPSLFMNSRMQSHGVANTYAYLWNVSDPAQIQAGLGVPHVVEMDALLGEDYAPGIPASYRSGGINERATAVMRGFWTSFVRTLDPNVFREDGTSAWDPWEGGRRMVFETGARTSMEDVGQGLRERCLFWEENALEMLL
ncbi:hypothetical protein S40285_06123 [Stachybotrys chlorohalonatus IBT 40285]|uniref:Carboxylic ester hydrolase n=1 Tax=Stachybotrys chlorohalonatus (strain IBT 40285) TaxID=1283841 RepID=A0A084QP96_STAC4|nr:hypothetical protein S40285_06123 [Stachybotrys chlorohalonata IBT 40285]